jgi:CDP-glycerol glycerophosphotransferase (TagB/SpsB family)
VKILLYGDWPLALTYLQPLATYIQYNEPDWVVQFAGDVGAHASPPIGVPDVVVTCDELSVAPDAPLKICIFHGLASKGQAFSSARKEAFTQGNQVFAVAGPYYETLLLDLGVPQDRIFVAGVTKFDGMQRNILYAPTHNPQLSAIPVVKDRIYEIPNVKVHLHMYIRTGMKPHHQQFRSYYPDHQDREDVADLIDNADVIIGDMGSMIVEAIGLGKQAIQVVNPNYQEWYMRFRGLTWEEMSGLPEIYLPAKYGKRVYSFDELKDALSVVANVGSASEKIVKFIKQRS